MISFHIIFPANTRTILGSMSVSHRVIELFRVLHALVQVLTLFSIHISLIIRKNQGWTCSIFRFDFHGKPKYDSYMKSSRNYNLGLIALVKISIGI